ncbi:cupin domain-containing protein [Mucilaginibacter agri]|uniref:Cupin domain-containing protein n=1 Tax=Mucilaginibacter agri TaxID=2695265 RepID=A0A965ZFW5_9SPHI|nr:cupin domain-containing protein [Mucilaginibacter agri]NCD70185.1 cupin domain-containing protein [Mucilaginibacter agri]
MNPQLIPLTITTDADGPCVSVAGGNYRVVISGKQTGGEYAVIDMLVPPNGGPGPHAHVEIQEAFYVLDGEVEIKTEEQTYTAKRGTYINIPKGGMVHCFKNKTDTLARLLCYVMPAGMDDMFLEIGKPVEPGVFLPAPQLGPDDIKKLMEIGERYGQKFYPPDYLDK